MKPDQERVRNLLTDTVTLLCKNGLQYQTELRVQGVLGITLDNNDVFIVHINEKFGDAIGGTLTIRNDEGDSAKTSVSIHSDTKKSHDAGRGDMPIAVNTKTGEVVHRRRRRSRESSASPALPTNNSQQHILQRPIKRLMPSNKEASPSGVRNRSSVQNSTGNDSVMPNEEEVVEVKVKTEEEDVIVLEEKDSHDRTEMGDTSQHIPHRTDHNAMQDSYPNLSLSELQGNYQPFGEILGVTDSSTNSGADGTAPPPTKRRAASGNTQDSFGGSSEMGPTPDAGGPFITGIIRNETIAGDGAPQTSTTTSWDPSQMPDLSTLTPQDSQMILDSTPGCSAWDTSQQPQVSAATTMTSHTLPNMSEQSSESVWSGGSASRFPTGQRGPYMELATQLANSPYSVAQRNRTGCQQVQVCTGGRHSPTGHVYEERLLAASGQTCSHSVIESNPNFYQQQTQEHLRHSSHGCIYCGSSFRSKSQLWYHIRTKHTDRLFECPHCRCNLASRGGLNQHVKHIHQKLARYLCETCGKGYSNRSNYYDHLATHAGVKRNICTICQKQFTFKPGLKAHFVRVHPNELALM